MKENRKQIVANVLIIISLVFLAGFLILFLINSYKKEKENLQKEVGYLFVNSIRKIEGSVLDKLVWQNDSSNTGKFRFPVLKRDSLHVKTILSLVDDDKFVPLKKSKRVEENLKIELRHSKNGNNLNQLEGSVAMFIAMSGDTSKLVDSCVLDHMSGEFLNELKMNFKKNMEAANLRVAYSIHMESEKTNDLNGDLVTGSYTDISNGDKYLVNIDSFGLLIYAKIFPEFVFSFLLFICVGLAFYMVHKSLTSERNLLNLKNDFIQNITHELKTPIATVSVALEALQDFQVSDDINKRTDYLTISKNELKRLSLLVDKVLNISQLEDKLPIRHSERLDLYQVITEILNTLKLQFDKMKVEISREKHGNDFTILGDRQRMDGLLYNLLDNAIKYNDKENPKIGIQLSRHDDRIRLTIMDNGIGISQEHQKNVFGKFYRVPHGNIHNVKGHGLGLNFVDQVVKEMRGEILLRSKEGEGSEFIITFKHFSNLDQDA